MAIYRGPGGSGDATTDASNEATIATTKAAEAAASASSAASSATNASNSATSASTNATNSASSASSASSSASSASSSASSASSSASAASSSAAEAAASATEAETAQTGAETAQTASEAAQSAAELAQTSAELAETNAESAQAAAELAQTGAETAETNAETAQAAAETAQGLAENAQAAAEAVFDNFDDSYLGPKASDPSVDNDGDPLTDGALYFDTTNNVMKVYDLGTTTWYQLTPTVSNQTNINTVAGISSDVSTVAANTTDISTVASIDTDVTTVAGISSDVTTVADNLVDVTTFADLYLGAESSAPTTTTTGALYFNTTTDQLYVWDGSAWQEAAFSVTGAVTSFNTRTGAVTLSATDVNTALGSDAVLDSDIGSTVQAYDADTAKYDDTTANFTGTLQNGGSNVVVDTDIGSTVQAYDADTTKNDVANTFTANQTINGDLTVDTNTLYVDSANNRVGIGTASPSYKLHVSANSPSTYEIATIQNTGTAAYSLIRWINSGNQTVEFGITQSGSNAAIINVGGTERMRITSGGNLGIGTTAPLSKLNSVASNAAAVTALTLNNSNSGFAADEAVDIDFGVGSSVTAAHGKLRVANATATSGSNSYMSFYTRAADVLAEKMRIDSSGNVGIGIANTFGNKVFVRGSTNSGLAVNDGSNTITMYGNGGTAVALGTANSVPLFFTTAVAERMRIDASGNVGIGTSSPQAKAVVSNNGASGIELFVNYPGGGVGTYIQSYNRSGAAYVDTAYDAATHSFRTSGTERMRIDSSGNVGIGTTSPTAKLQSYTTGSTYALILDNNNAPVEQNYISFNSLGIATIGRIYRPSGSNFLSLDSNYNGLIFKTGSSGTATERMRIDSSGNVGIGTTSPGNKLHVVSAGQSDPDGIIRAENSNGSTSPPPSASLIVKAHHGTSQLMQWGDNGVRIGSRITTNGGAGNVIFTAGSDTERMRIDSSGEVYIAGTTDQGAYNLQCNGTGVWGAGAYVNGSDERIKENIVSLDSGLDVVAKLNPVTYTYKQEWSKDQSTQTGFIAQELLTALDGKNYVDGIVQQGGKYMSVAYQNIIPILTKAIQEQQDIIKALEARIQTLENK